MTRWALRMRRPGGRRFPATAPRPSVITVTRPRLEEMEARLAPAALIAPTPSAPVAVGNVTSGGNLVGNASAGTTSLADYSSPVVVADPTNPARQVMVTQFARRDDGLLGVVGQYTTNSGGSWFPLANFATPMFDPTSTASPLTLFPNTSQASATFGRDGVFYVSYVQQKVDNSAGAVVVQSYSFAGGTPAPRSIVSPGNQTLNRNLTTALQQVIYRWTNSQDSAANPVVAVDSNVPTFTEPGFAANVDTLVNATTGAPKAVYVAYSTVGVEPTGNDSPNKQARFFNANAVWAAVSTDAGRNFSAPIAVNGQGVSLATTTGQLIGSTVGYTAASKDLNTGGTLPVIAFSPGTSAAPGRAVIGWSNVAVPDAKGVNYSTANFDVTAPDGGNALNTAGSIVSFTRSGAVAINDAILDGITLPDGTTKVDAPVFTDYPVTVDLTGLTATDRIANLTVGAVLRHRDLGTISLQLVAPDGTTVTLFDTRTDLAGAARPAVGFPFNQAPGLAASPAFANPASKQGLGLGRSAGPDSNQSFGTVFDDYAARRINDPKNAFPYIGTYKAESWDGINGALSVFAGKPLSYLTAVSNQWKLRVTDFRNDRYAPTDTNKAPLFFDYFSLNVTAGANQALAPGMTNDAKLPGVLMPAPGAVLPIGPTNPAGDLTGGLGSPISIAFDTSIQPYNDGSALFGRPSGQLYVAYTFNAAAKPLADAAQYDVRLARATLSPTADGGSILSGGTVRVNDDSGFDNFSEGDRTQFQPTVAVDPATGTVGVMWYDGRYDAAKTRVSTYLALSSDGGTTFSPSNDGGATPGAQVYLNLPRTAIDVIEYAANAGNVARSTVAIEPTPTIVSSLGVLGLGQRQSLIAIAPGKFASYWTGNQNFPNEGFSDDSKRAFLGGSVFRNVVTGAAGPRVIAGDMGPVGRTGPTPGAAVTTNNTLNYFTITFDRPVDVATFKASDVAVQFRSPLNGVRNLVANTDFGDPVAMDAGGVNGRGATTFYVPFLIPQTAVGTYSYAVGPQVNDLLRGSLAFAATPLTNFTPLPTSYPAAPAIGTPSVTNYAVVVTDLTGLIVRSPRVTLALVPNAAQIGWLQDLVIELVAPDGTTITLYNGPSRSSTSNTQMDAEFRDATDGGVPLPVSGNVTGRVQAETALSAFGGKLVAGTWTVRVTNNYTADGVVNAVGISFVTSLTVPTAGNSMDQDANGLAGVANLDAFAAPRALGRLSNPTAFPFPINYDGLTAPLSIAGPQYVAPPGERLVLNDAARFVDVAFDRDMDPTSFDADGRDVLRVLGPNGTIFDQNDWVARFPGKAFPVSVASLNARTFRVTFPTQVISGNYNIEFGPNIRDTLGNALDTNRNAGLAVLRGGDPTAGATVLDSYNSGGPSVAIPAGATVSMPLVVSDSFTIQETLAAFIGVRVDLTHPNVPDLVADLVAPDGTTVRLFTAVGQTGQANFSNTAFSDAGTSAIQNGTAPFNGGPYTPQFPLSVFRGQPSTVLDGLGVPIPWRLVITNTGTVAGRINNYSITLPHNVPGTGLGEAVADRFTVPFRIFTQDATNKLTQQVFTPVGPAPANGPGSSGGNNTGRMTGVAIDPSDPTGNTAFVGGASGGIFKTTNFLTEDPAGPNWIPLTDFGPTDSLNTGSIAVFARNNDPNQSIVFVLTGEGDSGTGGVGVLRSLDGGRTWKVLDSTSNSDGAGNVLPIDSNARDRLFFGASGFKIIVDPTLTPTGDVIVYLAVSGRNRGVYRSTNTGLDWQLVRAGDATDVFLAAGRRSTVPGSSGALTLLYAAFRGEGVFTASEAPTALSMSPTNVAQGVNLIRNIDTAPTDKAVTVSPRTDFDTPNGARGRIHIIGPAATGDVLQDTFYSEWLYAVVSDGTFLDGLYMTKDTGRNWVRVKIPALLITDPISGVVTAGFPTNNETRIDQSVPGKQAEYNLNIAVDPTDPQVFYVGGLGNGNLIPLPAGGLVRVDVSGILDSQAFTTFDDSSATQPGPQSGTTGGISFLPNDQSFPRVVRSGTANQNFFNLSRNPNAPFLSNASVRVTKAVNFTSSGDNAKYSGFTDFLNTADTHRLITFKDQLTGKARLIVVGDHQIDTGVDDGSGRLVNNVGYARSVNLSRNGNLQVLQSYSGAAQPSQLAVDLARALFYGNAQDNGFPVSGPDVLSGGNLSWTGIRGDGTGVATDSTGSGTSYHYRQPCCFNDRATGFVASDFFRVVAPGTSPSGVGSTNGLVQAGDDPAAGVGQWPRNNAGVGYFAVNPIDGSGILMSSAAGRVFRTTNKGLNWAVVGEPGQLDGSPARATAFGAPNPGSVPGQLNNYLFAGTAAGNIFVTETGGAPWRNISAGLDGRAVMQIVPDPQRGSRAAYAVTTGGIFYRADTRAGSWVNISGTSANSASGNIKELRTPIFGDANDTGTNPSPNQAVPFDLRGLSSLVADWRYAIPTDPAFPTANTFPILYAAGTGGVFRSLNRGRTWEVFPESQVLVDPVTLAPLLDPITGLPQRTARGGYLPNVEVSDLDLSLGNIDPLTGLPKQSSGGFNMLTVTTYGRGTFAIRLEDPASVAQYNTLAQSGPRVVGLAANTSSSVRVRFDAPVVATTFDPTDVVLTNAAGQVVTVTGVTPVVNVVNGADQRNLFEVAFTALAPNDSYTVTVGQKIADFAGFGMNQNRDRFNGDATLSNVTGNTIAGKFTPASVDSYTGTFVTINAPTQLGNLFIDQPYFARAGDPVPVVVTATAPSGNPLTTFTGKVHFTSTDAQISAANGGLPNDYTFTSFDAGSKVFEVRYRSSTFVAPPAAPPLTPTQVLAGSGTQSLTATDINPIVAAQIGAATEKIVVRGGAAKTFDVFGIPSPTVAGSLNDVKLTARDAFGNVSDGFTGGVTFSTTDPLSTPANGGLPSGFSFVATDYGQVTIAQKVSLRTVGKQSVSVVDNLTAAVTGAQKDILVVPAAGASFTVTGHAITVVAGTASDFTVTAFDRFGNVATGYTGTVRITSTDPQYLEPDYTFTLSVGGVGTDNGVHKFLAYSHLKTVGVQSVIATDSLDPTITGKQTGIVVTPAAASKFDVFGIANPLKAGVLSDVKLTARDPFNNVDTNYTGAVTFTSSDAQVSVGDGLPTNYTFVTGNKGQATLVQALTLRTVVAGGQSVSVADVATGLLKGSQVGIVVTPTDAAKFDVFGIPSPTIAGGLNDVQLTARDKYNNVSTYYAGTVKFSSSDALVSVGDGLPADYTFLVADNGSAKLSKQLTLRTAGLQSVSVADTATGLLTGTQKNILVVATVAASFDITGIPSPTVAGVPTNVTITARDRFQNVATSYTGGLTFSSSDPLVSVGSGLPSGFAFVAADNGKATIVNQVALKTAGLQSVSAKDDLTGLVFGSQNNILVIAAAAKRFDVFGITTPIVAGVQSDVNLTARDAYNNVADGFRGNVTFTSSDPQVSAGVGLPADYTFTAANAGKATLVKLLSLRTVGVQSVTVTDVATGLATGKQTGITVTPAAASKFDVFGIPSPVEAGKLSNVLLTARDPFNNVDTNFKGDVSFFSSDPLVSIGDGLPVNLTFFAADKGQTGVTDQVSLKTAGFQSVSAKDTKTGLLVGSQVNILVTPTVASSLKLGGHRTPVVAGTKSDFTATAFDRFGNVATGYKGTLHITSSDAQAGEPADYTFTATDAGSHTFVLGSQLKTAGKQSVTATDTVIRTITATQPNIVVVAAPAAKFVITGHPSPVVAGSKNGFTVLATDPFGNRATSYLGSVAFTSSDPLVSAGNGLPNQYTFAAADSGSHLFLSGAQLKTAGLQGITAADLTDGFTGSQVDILVTSAPATTLNLTGFPNPTLAGAAGTYGVVARDQYGNQATTYKGTLRFSTSDPLVSVGKGLPADYAFTAADNGFHAFVNGATLKTAGLQSLAATDTVNPSIAGAQSGILVTPDVAASLALVGYPSPVAAGTANPFTVTARDRFGNLATGYDGTVIFDSSDRQVGANKGLPSLYTFTPADNGQRTFVATLKTAGTQTISTTDVVTPSLKASQAGIAVTAGALSRLTVAGYPTPVVAGLDTGLTVSAADAFDNPVFNFAGTVQFSTSDKQGTVPAAYTFTTADKGRKTFATGFALRTAGLQSITGAVASNAQLTASQTNIAVVAAAATTFKFSGFPNPVTALSPATFTVTAFDPFGNFASGYKGDLVVTSSDPRAIVTNPVRLTNGVGTGTVTFRAAGTQSVTVADPNDPAVFGTSGGIAVAPALPGVVDPGSLNPLSLSDLTAVGTDAGVPSLVRVLNPDGTVRNEFAPYDPSFVGGVRVALQRTPFGPRVVTAPGSGLSPDVRVYDLATGKVTQSILPFESTFTGGVFVTTGDINNDGYDDIVLSPDNGGGPRVRIIDGKTFATLSDFFGIDDKAFRGGVRSTLTDVNGDGVNDLVVAAGFGGGPRVAIYDGRSVLTGSTAPLKLVSDFFAFEPELRNGAYVAGGDVNGDGFGDLAFGAGPGGGPRVRVVNGKQIVLASPFPNLDLVPQAQIGNFFSGDLAAAGGVRVTMKRLSTAEGVGAAVITGSGTGNGTFARSYPADQILGNVVPNSLWEYEDLPGLNSGVFVG